MAASDESRISYVTLLIGKEVLAFNGGDGLDDALDRFLSILFQVKRRASGAKPPAKRARTRRPRAGRRGPVRQ
jgi:hypothetical protein